MPDHVPALLPSIITSSSTLALNDLLREVLDLHGDVAFDLMLLRPEDTDAFSLHGTRITDLVAQHGAEIQQKIAAVLGEHHTAYPDRPLRIPALATYFPDISSMDEALRQKACTAITNCVRLCHQLMQQKDSGLIITPIVEIVCGSLLEPREGTKNLPGLSNISYQPRSSSCSARYARFAMV